MDQGMGAYLAHPCSFIRKGTILLSYLFYVPQPHCLGRLLALENIIILPSREEGVCHNLDCAISAVLSCFCTS